MAGVIKKLYHPIDNGTVTTAVSQELQEVYPITATNGVYAPEGAFHANDSLDQILRWLDANKISGSGLKTLTVNGTEQSLIGSGTIVINAGGGGGSDSDFFELDASGNLHVKNDRGLYTGSFISAGGVGSGGGGGGSDTLAGLSDTEITNPGTVGLPLQSLIYDKSLSKWINGTNYRPVNKADYDWTPSTSSSSNYHTSLPNTTATSLVFWEGDGINISLNESAGVPNGTIRFHVKLKQNGGLAFDNGELYSTGGSGTTITPGDGLTFGSGSSANTLSIKLASGSGLEFSNGGLKVSGGGTVDTNTWRSFTVNGNNFKNTSTQSGLINFKNGDDISITNSGNDLTIGVDRSSLKTTLDGYFVHLSGNGTNSSAEESITGLKTFVSGLAIGNNTKTITLSSGTIVINGDVQVNGNFYATGNVTAGLSNS